MPYLKRATTKSGMVVSAPKGRKACTDLPCLLLFLAMLGGLGYIAWLGMPPRGDLRRVIHGMDQWSDVCGMDNSVAATGQPLEQTVITGKLTFWHRLWFLGSYPPPGNRTIRRGGRDHRSRPMLYFTFPTGAIGGVPSLAICVSQCPHDDLLWNGSYADPDALDGTLDRAALGAQRTTPFAYNL